MDNNEDKIHTPVLTSQQIVSTIAFVLFLSFLAVLYVADRTAWQNEIHIQKQQLDSLNKLAMQLLPQHNSIAAVEEQRIKAIAAHRFDAFNAGDYRVYGLFRDENKQFTISQISEKYGIHNLSAIKVTDVLGERWFVVPVKGTHFVKKGENAGKIAALYYKNAADSTLILDFNTNIRVGKFIFIPFN
jgi:hypothetical protein